MRRSLRIAAACALATAGVAAGIAVSGLSASSGDPPNQGDPTKVLTVVSGYVCQGTVVFGPKVEGEGLGPTITVTAATPIVKVTIKSGEKAALVAATWSADYRSGTITISQDVSNYVVWTCAGGGTTSGTTETTPTTTETTPATTETTPATTETTPTTTETTPATTPTTTETTPTATETAPATTVVAPAAPLRPPVGPPESEEAPAAAGARGSSEAAPEEPAGVAAATGPVLAYTP